MTITKIIGAALISSPFAGVAVLCHMHGGWSAVAVVFGASGAVVAVIALGCRLLVPSRGSHGASPPTVPAGAVGRLGSTPSGWPTAGAKGAGLDSP